MDARKPWSLVLLLCLLLGPGRLDAQQLFRAQSRNFVVTAADQVLAKQVAHEAERFRKELAVEWLGYELGDWSQKCPITVELAPQSGGETTFAFVGPPGQTQPVDWSMKIYGPSNRLLDAVLPHEVTHTIFATHFGRPLPRWADEGACTTVEHESERKKIQALLMDYLTSRPSKGIPFNRLFVLMQYPDEMLPLYAQGYSLARYLVLQKGRRHFVKFVESGLARCQQTMTTQAWDQAVAEYYGFRDLSDLQVSWVAWVKSGSPESAVAVASLASDSAPENVGPVKPKSNLFVSSTMASVEKSWYHQQVEMNSSPPSSAGFEKQDQRVPTPNSIPGSAILQAGEFRAPNMIR